MDIREDNLPDLKRRNKMATHGRARQLTIAALNNKTPFARSGFAMKGVEGAVSSTGEMPKEHAETYKMHASNNDIAYTVLSYVTPIAYVTRYGDVIVPDYKYSRTTSHHQGLCRVYL
jgi:hypothetical protein